MSDGLPCAEVTFRYGINAKIHLGDKDVGDYAQRLVINGELYLFKAEGESPSD